VNRAGFAGGLSIWRYGRRFHWTPARVRAHVLLCMLAYYLELHMRQALAPMLFDDHDRAAAEVGRTSPVAKTKVSKAAYRKASTQRVDAGDGESHPVHSLRTPLLDLATLTRNTVCFGGQKMLTVQSTASPVQRRALSNYINDLHRKGDKVQFSIR
jgi:hypothetical protein